MLAEVQKECVFSNISAGICYFWNIQLIEIDIGEVDNAEGVLCKI